MADRCTAQWAEAAHVALRELEAERVDLVADRVAACRALHDEGWSLSQIADLLAVSKTAAARIVG